MSGNTSSLTGPALQASRAALSAALAEHDQTSQTVRSEEELIEAGEIQEVDMQGQAEAIRTVFSDPNNFNVKVRVTKLSKVVMSDPFSLCSILSILHGRCGSIRLQPRVAICHRHLYLRCRRPRCPKHQMSTLLLRDGWKISNGSLVSIVLKSFGGTSSFIIHVPFRSSSSVLTFRLYNNIVPPSQLPQKANYYLFKVRSSRISRSSFLMRSYRKGSSPLGKTMLIKVEVNGVYSCPRTKTRVALIECGCIRYGLLGHMIRCWN